MLGKGKEQRGPNGRFFVVDNLGYFELGCLGWKSSEGKGDG